MCNDPRKDLFQKKIFLDDKDGLLKCIFDNYALDINLDKDPLRTANILINEQKSLPRKDRGYLLQGAVEG